MVTVEFLRVVTHKSLILFFLAWVRDIVMLTVLISNPRNVIIYVGKNTDFFGWIWKPRPSTRSFVSWILSRQSLHVSPANKKSSTYFTDEWPCYLRQEKGGFRIFVNTLMACRYPFSITSNWYAMPVLRNFGYFLCCS